MVSQSMMLYHITNDFGDAAYFNHDLKVKTEWTECKLVKRKLMTRSIHSCQNRRNFFLRRKPGFCIAGHILLCSLTLLL